MIKLRIDVDYPYPSRLQSFLFTLLNTNVSRNYLRNAKVIAKMVNESPREVMAYWFFTPQTTPDRELLAMLQPERHEVALHVANDPYAELEKLEKATSRKVKFYTVHGTARLMARLMWRRKLWESRARIPEGFPLKSFYEFPTLGLDVLCYSNSTEQAVKIAEQSIKKGEVLHIHPEWLFQRGTLNHRGPYYETLKTLLQTDRDMEGLVVRKKGFIKVASYAGTAEYERDFVPTEKFLQKLAERGVDVFTFIERKWCFSLPRAQTGWLKAEDNIALFHVTTYDEWWSNISKKTRNMVRKAEKSGVTTKVVDPSDKLAEGIWRIYNETPIRQGRAFPHFGQPLSTVKAAVFSAQNSTFIASFFEGEVVGFIQLVHGDKTAIISQILSLQKFWDKAVNNALVAKAIEVCAAKQVPWVMYGRMGNHPSLDNFKQSNSFVKFTFPRYYIPLTRKGRIATSLGIHRELKDALPQSVKKPLLPVFNWASRVKLKVRFFLH
ncbi:MAG: hypothetical protein ACQXXJ_02700 [Candidatus Bathyarchaeia archaeon]